MNPDNDIKLEFRDSFNQYLFDDEGIAVLGRKYVNNIHFYPKKHFYIDTAAACGITAFLGSPNIDSFKCALNKNGLNTGISEKVFFKKYFDICLKHLKLKDRGNAEFEDERKSEADLIAEHLKYEEQLLSIDQLFFTEYYEFQKPVIQKLNKASRLYIEWIKSNYGKIEKINTKGQPRPFFNYLIHDNPLELANVCKSIFNKNSSPKDFAIMLCILSEKGLINIQNRNRKKFFEAWYQFINKQLPLNRNFEALNKYIIDKAANGFVFKDETDMDFCSLRDIFTKSLI